jgi:hypothetical protein
MDELKRKLKGYAKVLKKNPNAFIIDVVKSENPFIIYHDKDTTMDCCSLPLILDYFRESLIVKKFNYKGIVFCTIRFREKWRQNVDFLREIVDVVKQHRTKKVKRTRIGTEW